MKVSCRLEDLPAPHALCRATVVVPARNEEASLAATLDALRLQVEADGEPLDGRTYEVLLLLNNCTDGSLAVAERYAERYPEFALSLVCCELAPEDAHVGTARRMLMDAACARLEGQGRRNRSSAQAILSTDADTLVAPEWVSANLAEITRGAEVVGGVIHLFVEELALLEESTRKRYERDRELQGLVAKLESMLDPDPADPWPRHLEHFGASLACTPAIYRLCGGLPAVPRLEDVAFIDALRKVGARLRHSPAVHIFTSARLDGRAEVGLSGQLRHWRRDAEAKEPQMVDSAAWLEHRFRWMGALRRLNECASPCFEAYPAGWRERLREAHRDGLETPKFLERIDCDGLIEEMFRESVGEPRRHEEIRIVLRALRAAIARLEPADVRAEPPMIAG